MRLPDHLIDELELAEFLGLRWPISSETWRRATILNHHRASLQKATKNMPGYADKQLEHANASIRAIISDVLDQAIGLRRNTSSPADSMTSASWTALNATAGLGKTTIFLEELAKRVLSNPDFTAVIIVPRIELGEQIHADFLRMLRSRSKDPDLDPASLVRTYLGVENACARTTNQHGVKRILRQRQAASKAGVNAEKFCQPGTKTDYAGNLIHSGCPLRHHCQYWTQRIEADVPRVWIVSQAAIRSGALAGAGITTRFDLRFIDEGCTGLFTEAAEVDFSRLPAYEGRSMLNTQFNMLVGDAMSAADFNTYAIRCAGGAFIKGYRDGSEGGLEDGDFMAAYRILPPAELEEQRFKLRTALDKFLHPREGQYGSSESDDLSEYPAIVDLKQIRLMREEAEAAMLLCEFLLSFNQPGRAMGYTVNTRGKQPVISFTRRSGFADRWLSDGDSIKHDGSEYAGLWQSYLDREEGAARPAFQFLGSPIIYSDATLTPSVVEACFDNSPDFIRGQTSWSIQYILVPDNEQLVSVIKARDRKFSRSSVGVSRANEICEKDGDNDIILDGDGGPVDRREELKRVASIQRIVSEIMKYHDRRGDNPVAIVPKAIVRDGETDSRRILALDQFDVVGAGGEMRPAYITSGAVSGINGYDNAGALIVLSQGFSENPRDYENLAIALTGKPVARMGTSFQRCDRHTGSLGFSPSNNPRQEDPLTEDLRWQAMEGQIIQAIARARGVRRGRSIMVDGEEVPQCSKPPKIYLLNRLQLGDYVTEVRATKKVGPSILELLFDAGIWIDGLDQRSARPFLKEMADLGVVPKNKIPGENMSLDDIPCPPAPGWVATIVPQSRSAMRKKQVKIRVDQSKRFDLIRSGTLHIENGLTRCALLALETLDPSIERLAMRDLAAMVEVDFGERPTSQAMRAAVEALEAPEIYEVCRTSSMMVHIHRP